MSSTTLARNRLAAAIVLLIAHTDPLYAADAPRKPNVILFLVDDMGWMDCGAYGSKYYETPNIDRFAARAMRFTDAYAQPLCSPTRACLLTGKYPSRHGITSATGHLAPQPAGFAFLPSTAPPSQAMLLPVSKNYLEPSEYTLAEALHDAGYRTAHIGKWHVGLTRPYWPERQGFDVAFHCHPDPGPPGNYFSPYGVKPDAEPRGRTRAGTITDGPPGEYIVDRLADEALEFIEANRDRPFFLNLWNYGVHGPWGHKPAYTQAFASKRTRAAYRATRSWPPCCAASTSASAACSKRSIGWAWPTTRSSSSPPTTAATRTATPAPTPAQEQGRQSAAGRLAQVGRRAAADQQRAAARRQGDALRGRHSRPADVGLAGAHRTRRRPATQSSGILISIQRSWNC